MRITLGESTLGLPVPDFTKGSGALKMQKSDPLHMNESGAVGLYGESGSNTFGDMLIKGLAGVDDAQNNASSLMTKAITDPDSMEAHSVTIAMAKAQMSLSIAKAVIDKSISGFKEILNER